MFYNRYNGRKKLLHPLSIYFCYCCLDSSPEGEERAIPTKIVGEIISKEEYIYLLNTGRYKIFKKIQ